MPYHHIEVDNLQVLRRIRTLIVVDAPEMLRTISAVLAAVPGVEVTGEAGTASEALSHAALLHPNLVVLDIRLPGNGGAGLVSQLRACLLPHVRIIALTVHEGPAFEIASSESSTDAFLPKSRLCQELPRFIDRLFPQRSPTP